MIKCRISTLFMRHFAFRFLLGGSTVVRHPLAKNEIQFDFSQPNQRVGLLTFLYLHLFLHAERNEQVHSAFFFIKTKKNIFIVRSVLQFNRKPFTMIEFRNFLSGYTILVRKTVLYNIRGFFPEI